MEVGTQPAQRAGGDLRLCLEWKSVESASRTRKAFAASAVLHAAGLIMLVFFPLGFSPGTEPSNPLSNLRSSATLIAPPPELTQKEPNTGKPSKEFDLQGLLQRPRLPLWLPSTTRPAAVSPFSTPQAPALPEPPRIDTTVSASIARGLPPVESPTIVPEEKPKLAFERPGSVAGSGTQSAGVGKPAGPAIAELSRELPGKRGGGLAVGELGEGIGGLGEGLNLPPAPGRPSSRLELLSDPMGVDFRPYLVSVLSAVRRNWFAVMPESAKRGLPGKVVIQFAVSRDGSVPKLVIASSSGTPALDRAAVAGISASTPFPPLPSGFRGLTVRLQLVFLYNMRASQ